MDFTEEQVRNIMYGGCICDDDNEIIFETVHEEITGTDQEKGSSEIEYVIEEVKTGKFFQATLGKSPWGGQSAHNAEEFWSEVEKYEVTTYKYRTK